MVSRKKVKMDSSLIASIELERSHIVNHPEEIIGDNEEVLVPSARCCHPNKRLYRYTALFFMCFLGFGSYFCYDMPAALQDQIKADLHISVPEFANLYVVYSWPNVVLSFFGGFLIDKLLGVRMGTIIFSTILTIGHYIVAIGSLTDHFWVLLLGRFIFGVGSESLAVAQNAYAVSWFKGKELNFVFGLLISMARIGSTVNFLASGPIYAWVDSFSGGYTTLGITFLIGGLTCMFSLICAGIVALMDRHRENVLHTQRVEVEEKIQLKDVISFPITFWLISAICVAYYVAIFPFIALAKVYFMDKYHMSESSANGVSSVVYIISAVASPVFGILVDKTGRNVVWVSVSVLTTLVCHGIIAFTMITPYVPMSIMGLAYSVLASSLWPMVSLILPDHMLGTAYGLMQSVQNLGLALITMASGYIVKHSGYFDLELFFIGWLAMAIISCLLLWFVDYKRHGILNLSARARANHNASILNEETEPLVQS